MSKLDSIRQQNTSEHNAKETAFEELQAYVKTLQASHDELLEAGRDIVHNYEAIRLNCGIGACYAITPKQFATLRAAIKKAEAIKK